MTPYTKRTLDMIEQWVAGKSQHNIIDNECCPDFSCCHPDLFEQDREKRIARLNKFRKDIGLMKHFDA